MEIRSIELIKTPQEMKKFLLSGKHITFIFPKKRKKFFKLQVDRMLKLQKLYSKRTNVLFRLRWFIYSLYVRMFELCISKDERELEYALTIFDVMWPYIEGIGGEDYADDSIKIIFRGKVR